MVQSANRSVLTPKTEFYTVWLAVEKQRVGVKVGVGGARLRDDFRQEFVYKAACVN